MNLLTKVDVPGVPTAVSVYALGLSAIGMGLGVRGLLDPKTAVNYVEGADPLAGAWAGRTLGLGLGMGAAVLGGSKGGLTVAFVGAVFREFGDVVGILPTGNKKTLAVLGPFLAADAVSLALCVRALRRR